MPFTFKLCLALLMLKGENTAGTFFSLLHGTGILCKAKGRQDLRQQPAALQSGLFVVLMGKGVIPLRKVRIGCSKDKVICRGKSALIYQG